MTRPADENEDFRTAAAVESARRVSEFQARLDRPLEDAMEAGISYCLPIEGLGRNTMRRLKTATILGIVIGIIGLGVAALIVAPINTPVDDMSAMRFVLALAFFALGMGSLFAGATCQRRYVRRSVRDRLGDLWQPGMPKPIDVGIEDSRTFTKPKLVPEDIGAVICYPDRRCVQIEGVCYRYLIYSDDVTHLKQVTIPQGQAVTIEYRVGDASLSLALVPINLAAEIKRQTIGGKSALMKTIQETLTPASSDMATPPHS